VKNEFGRNTWGRKGVVLKKLQTLLILLTNKQSASFLEIGGFLKNRLPSGRLHEQALSKRQVNGSTPSPLTLKNKNGPGSHRRPF
jgi:hypothetical protein